MIVTDQRIESKIKTGIDGIDDILQGGLPANHVYLLEGEPGSGKTTFGLQFLLAGAAQGESCLYITLSESKEDLIKTAASHGWDLSSVTVHELFPENEQVLDEGSYTFFHASEIELAQTTKSLESLIEQLNPQRVVIDSLSELRLIANDRLLFRRQLTTLKSLLVKKRCTMLLIDDIKEEQQFNDLESLVHGVIQLKVTCGDYGPARFSLRVLKLRGTSFYSGYHDFVIAKGGIVAFPRVLITTGPSPSVIPGLRSTGCKEFDALLGGGVDPGSTTLISGQPGVGKSSIASQFISNFAASGGKSLVLLFDETVESYIKRSRELGHDLQQFINQGLISIFKAEPSNISPGEIIHRLHRAITAEGFQMLVIDSLDGYLDALSSEKVLILQLHDLLTYLSGRGVTVIIVTAQHGFIASLLRDTPNIPVSYLADTILILRYFEAAGRVRRAIIVIKKRTGTHADAIHQIALVSGVGLKVGEPLHKFQGILTGVPQYLGPIEDLFKAEAEDGGADESAPHQ